MPVSAEQRESFADLLQELLTPNAMREYPLGVDGRPLRLSQVEGLSGVHQRLRAGEDITYVVQPGGSGKTWEGIALADIEWRRRGKALFVVLQQQTLADFAAKAAALFPDMNIGRVYSEEKQLGEVTFITYQSLLRRVLGEEALPEEGFVPQATGKDLRIDPAQYGLVVWDEAHMYLTPNAQALKALFGNSIHVGLTASPRYYEGKEVEGVFGRKAYELLLATARERGEICDYENLLVTTDIETGILLSSPEQEESPEVVQAINRRDRNLIIADLYLNEVVEVVRGGKRKEHTLAGEPTIVFGGSVDHVHALARDVNEALMPLLRPNTEMPADMQEASQRFRQALQEKGINPEELESIIEPIHTSASEEHAGMSLDQRNALVKRYHERKVLMLASTSVLQQSFDSPATSVVIDAIARKTYVGVAQPAMRALRPGKEIAILINMQDADNPSLTFTDFEVDRGVEEGLVVEIDGAGTNRRQKEAHSPEEMADYSVTSGSELYQQAFRRRAGDREDIYRHDSPYRFFTPQGYALVNKLIVATNRGEAEARSELIRVVMPQLERIHQKTAKRIFGKNAHFIEEDAAFTAIGALEKTISAVENGRIQSWTRFLAELTKKIEVRLERMLIDRWPATTFTQRTENEEPSYRPQDPAMQAELRDVVHRVLVGTEGLSDNEKFVAEKSIMMERTLVEVADELNVTPVRVSQIRSQVIRKLAEREGFVPLFREWRRENSWTPLQKIQTLMQVEKNEAAMKALGGEETFMKHKRDINNSKQHLNIPSWDGYKALWDVESTDITTLLSVLEPHSIESLSSLNARDWWRVSDSVEALQELVRQCTQMGAKPLTWEQQIIYAKYYSDAGGRNR